MLRLLVAAVLALALPAAALASAVIESLTGTVEIDGIQSSKGQRISPQSTMTTGSGAQAFLRFDDGMQVVLGAESVLRLVDFRYRPGGGSNRAVLELMRGSARVVTGAVARNDPKQFWVRTPQVELMVAQPADFTVALVNPAYIAVKTGALIANNASGTATLNAGTNSVVNSSGAAPANISASQMPAQASNAMNTLSTASVNPPTTTATGAPFTGGQATPLLGLDLAIIGAAAAAVATLIAGEDDDFAPPSHH